MAKKFLSKKIIISAIIFFGGVLIAFGVLMSANFTVAKLFTDSQHPQWIQNVGNGISAPACESAAPSMTCVGGAPSITFFYDFTGWGGYKVSININDDFIPIADNLPVPSGSFVWNGATNNTFYNYTVRDWSCAATEFGCIPDGGLAHQYTSNLTTPNCSTGTLQLRATLNGAPWSGSITYSVSSPLGATTTTRILPADNSSAPTGDYTYTYISGGPPGATFTGITPSSSQTLSLGETITFTFNFVTLPGDFTLSVGGGLACNSVPLSWTASSGADGYRILKGAARVDITPYNPYTALNFTDTSVSQNTNYLYQIEAYNTVGTNRSNVKNVTTPYCPPTLNFSGDPTTIYEGGSSTLTWSSTYTTSCTASGAWSGSKSLNGEEIVIPLPPPSVTYTMTCTGLGGSTGPQSVIINVTPLGLPQWKEIIPR